jgi:hypothetical protein
LRVIKRPVLLSSPLLCLNLHHFDGHWILHVGLYVPLVHTEESPTNLNWILPSELFFSSQDTSHTSQQPPTDVPPSLCHKCSSEQGRKEWGRQTCSLTFSDAFVIILEFWDAKCLISFLSFCRCCPGFSPAWSSTCFTPHFLPYSFTHNINYTVLFYQFVFIFWFSTFLELKLY